MADMMVPTMIVIFGVAASPQPERDAVEDSLNRAVRPYSTQRIVLLDVGESATFTLRKGKSKRITLISAGDRRDKVVDLARESAVVLEVDGKKVSLRCAPYTMPTTVAGMRVLVDSTSAWGNVPKRVQLSLWDATDPIVDTAKFGMAVKSMRLFSEGTQCYNEPVHLGAGDGDPEGQRFYHDYGFDVAGYEGRDEVVGAVAGTVHRFWPSREDLCSVLIVDAGGMVWEHGHLAAVEPWVQVGSKVVKGQKIGLLGRTGPSGNFSHTHLGTCLSVADADSDKGNRRLNLYPWHVAAFQAAHPSGILAVARPHVTALTGEEIVLDGGNSLAWGGRKIVSWRWELPDGRVVRTQRATLKLDKPGTYSAALWIKDDKGTEDVDFCTVKAYTAGKPESGMPHVFVTTYPTEGVKPGKEVFVRFWLQGAGDTEIEIAIDDKPAGKHKSYTELKHAFEKPGIHVIEAKCTVDGKSVTQKAKVIVERLAP